MPTTILKDLRVIALLLVMVSIIIMATDATSNHTNSSTATTSITPTATAAGATGTTSQNATTSPTVTMTEHTLSITDSALSNTHSASQEGPSSSKSWTVSYSSTKGSPTSQQSVTFDSMTPSYTSSANKTQTRRLSLSASLSYSLSQSQEQPSSSLSSSELCTISITDTITPPPTPSKSRILTPSGTELVTATMSSNRTLTKLSLTLTDSLNVTLSVDPSKTLESLSRTKPSVSVTDSPTPSLSDDPTPTMGSITWTDTPSDSMTVVLTETQIITASRLSSSMTTTPSVSMTVTISMQLTHSIAYTTTHVPTPSVTLLTACPACGHGTCTDNPPYVCQCFLSYRLGFWAGGEVQGATCDNCLANFYGSTCKNACPGGVCTPCNNHGICSDGTTGTGLCTCYNNSVGGYWTGDSCDRCQPGFYGSDCRGVCVCDADKGTCQDGTSGTGACRCFSGRTGQRCDSCASGYFVQASNSSTCVPCPGFDTTTGVACNGHGSCDPTSGICYCTDTYTSSSNCSDAVSGTVNGCVPACQNNGTCQFGKCVCDNAFRGPQCQGECPYQLLPFNATNTTLVRTLCSGHGTCYYNASSNAASCTCYTNTSFGFYDASTNCSTCQDGYGGSRCTIACPAYTSPGLVSTCSVVTFMTPPPLGDICNKTTGTCNCVAYGRCRDDCSQSTNCNGICAATNVFGLDCNHTCINGTTVNWMNSSGRCICNPGFVGTSCDILCGCSSNSSGSCPYNNETCKCASGYAGPTCAIQCPVTVNGTCSNNGYCNEGASGNGQCVCSSGFVGVACETICKCVNASIGSCTVDGTCVCAKSTWRMNDDCGACLPGRAGYNCRTQCVSGYTSGLECICNPNYGGAGCDKLCPNTTSGGICNGQGNCSDGNKGTGTCSCNAGYLGPSCNCTNAGCAADRSNSACNITTGQCTCVLPFGGPTCEDCADGYWGYSCRNVCPCAAHGTCDRVRGKCTCFSDATRGFWTGSLCTSCQSGYNLPDCIQASSASTQLASFQSVYLQGKLYYTAKQLIVIEDLDIAVALGPVTTLYANISQLIPNVREQFPFAANMSYNAQLCNLEYAWVAARTPVLRNDTVTGVVSAVDVPGRSLYVSMLCSFATPIVIVQEYPVEPVEQFLSYDQRQHAKRRNNTLNVTIPNLQDVLIMKQFQYRSVEYLAVAATVDYEGNTVNAFYSVNFDRMARAFVRTRQGYGLSDNLEATLSSIAAVEYDPIGEVLILVASFEVSGVATDAQRLRAGVYLCTFQPTVAGLTIRLFLSQYQTVSYGKLIIVSSNAHGASTSSNSSSNSIINDTAVLMLLQVTNGTQDLIRVNLTAAGAVVSYASSTLLASSDLVIMSLYDALSGVVWAFSNSGKTFKIIRFLLESSTYSIQDGNGMVVIGSQLFPQIPGADRRVIDVQASFLSRQLYLMQLNASGTVVRRFLMYENLAIFPRTVSRLANPTITITGRGFTNGSLSFFPGNIPRCRIQSGTVKYDVAAILVMVNSSNSSSSSGGGATTTSLTSSSTQLICPLDSSNTSLCSADVVEVAIFSDFFTTSQRSIPRYQQPILTSVSPTVAALADGIPVITVVGTGFVDSGILMCRFTPQNATMATVYPVADVMGSYISSTQVRCNAPTVVRAMRLFVNVACDGNIFTTQTTDIDVNLVAVVGTPYNITTSISTMELSSQEVVTVPTVVISFVDDQGSSLFLTVSDRIEVVATFEGGLAAQGELVLANDVGTFSFDQMQVLSPVVDARTAVLFTARLLSAVTSGASALYWAARVKISILSGSPHHLELTNAPTADAGIPETNRIAVIEVTVQDFAGNRVSTLGTSTTNNASALTYTATLSLIATVATNVYLPAELYTLYPASDFDNLTLAFSGGTAQFTDIEVNNTRGGLILAFLITTNVTRESDGMQLTARTVDLIPKCNAGKIRFLGDTSCRACPVNMQCPDATKVTDYGNLTLLITVSAGYYRSSVYAADAVACVPTFACTGGQGTGGCAVGYAGALCGLCEDRLYGRSIIGGDCVECYDSRVSTVLLFVVLLIIFTIFVLLTIAATQNWAVTMEPVVSLVLLITHLQSILGIGLTGFSFSQFFKNAMSYLGIFSNRVLDYFFSDCVLVGQGMTFYNKIAAFALMPAVALLMASIAWLTVFIAPRLLRFDRLQAEREIALTSRREQLIRRLQRNVVSTGNNYSSRPQFAKGDRQRRLMDQAELAAVEDELKNNLDRQGILPLQDYRILASHSMQVVLFFTFHTIIYYALTVFDCQEVPSGLGTVQSFLETDNRISCDSSEYRQYVTFGYLVSILYFVCVPVLFFVMYHIHRKRRPSMVLQRRQVFYVWTMGLKTGSWYWNAIVLLRKGLQFAFAAAIGSPADAHVIVWLFCAQLIWLLNLKPYWNHSNTTLEAVSLTSCIVGGSLCILFQEYQGDESRDAISAVILTVLLLPIPLFLFSATQKVWISVREEIRALRYESSGTDSSTDEEDVSVAATVGDAGPRTVADAVVDLNTMTQKAAAAKNNKQPRRPEDNNTGAQEQQQPLDASLTTGSRKLLRKVSIQAFLRADEDKQRNEEEEAARSLVRPKAVATSAYMTRTGKGGGGGAGGGTTGTRGSNMDYDRVATAIALYGSSSGSALEQPLLSRQRGEEDEAAGDRRSRSVPGSGDDIPALVPYSMLMARQRGDAAHSALSRRRQQQREGDDDNNDDDDDSLLSTIEGSDDNEGGQHPPHFSTSSAPTARRPAVLDDTARRVFEQQLRSDETSRRERAIDDLMALEAQHGNYGGDSAFDAVL